MADRGDTHYRVSSLNKWFLFSSAFFFVSLLWLMLDDWNRPWKHYQRDFRAIELERAEQQAQALESELGARESELVAQRDAAEAALSAQQAELEAGQAELFQARGDLWSIVEEAKKDKADYNWVRYLVEEARLKARDPLLRQDELEAAEARMNASIARQEAQQAEVDVIEGRVKSLTAAREAAQDQLTAGIRELDRARQRVEQLAPSDAPTRLANFVRDAPGLDFIGPSLKPQKVVLDDLTFELNFTKKKRIDMCHTCHLAIDMPGYEGEEQPFTTHPRLDLFLTATSPHALKDVGCTICHRGSGEALDFTRADHRPDVTGFGSILANPMLEEWHTEQHWHKQHHWDYPMLPKSMTEAGCVQCHTSSLDLIAEDAPTLTEGYRNFERFGCYACHKVEWFPTERKPGPALTNVFAKTSPEFVSSWVANPKAFRPTTWMPQIFHLENFAPDEVIAVSKYGQGAPILGQQWNETAVGAVVAFLEARAPLAPLPEIPLAGDATRGSEVFRLSGCLACHNMAPYAEDPDQPRDMGLEARGTNEHGPNLRGVASKVDARWLYHWIKDPAAYWHETRMPNLRLSDQDAADIVAYMTEDPDGYFTDVPEGWAAGPSPVDGAALQEMARWFFARDGRAVVEERLAGGDPAHPWDDQAELEVVVGEKLVAHYGCYSCHEISGMETMMPIGAELTNWASKTVDKLDFALMTHQLAEEHGWSHAQEAQFADYREGWLMQKLHAPRSYDREKVKNPTEKLRMPWFDFTDREIFTITTFVAGLVDDEVQRAKMRPNADQLASDAGLRAVRQHNCQACHMVAPGSVTFTGEDGNPHTVAAELLPVGDAVVPPAHELAELREEVEFFEADEVGLRLLQVEPGIGDVGERIYVDGVDQIVALEPPEGGDFIRLVTDYYFNGVELFDPEAEDPDEAFFSVTADPDGEGRVQDVDGQYRSFQNEQYDKVRWTYAPPVLWDEGAKIQKDWFFAFLNDVQPIRPQIRVRMPSFNFRPGEAGAIAEYFALRAAEEWPAHFARELMHAQGVSAAELAEATGLDPAAVAGVLAGDRVATRTSLAAIEAYAADQGFTWPGPVNPAFEALELRSSTYLDARAAGLPEHFEIGQQLVTETVNCYQCHFRMGTPPPADPIAWAPDLDIVHERLRESWTRRWLVDPARIYPGTSMPQNFADNAADYHAVYPDSTNAEQIETVLDYLFNFDRILMSSAQN